MHFDDLKLNPNILRAVATEGYTTPTPIQEKAIPHVLAGKDLVGLAQTGTGKTAAFALPMLHRLADGKQVRGIRALILTPTRELAAQIGESFDTYGKHLNVRNTVIFGGVGQNPQVQAIRSGVEVLIATPGRLIDLIGQGLVSLEKIEIFVLDEADRMLDMGFLNDVRKVIARLPKVRQTLLFSATMPDDIQDLAKTILRDPVQVAVTPVSSTAERISQSVYFVEKANKRRLLVALAQNPEIARALVFTRTKHGANRVAEYLTKAGVQAEAIHGNKSQSARERALGNFKGGTTRFLVATDIAARGIDVDGVSHVINFDLPNVPESYVHRIGRTARAGASGAAISFCDSEEREYLRDIERVTRRHVPVVETPPMSSLPAVPDHDERRPPRPPQHRPQPKPQSARPQQSHARPSQSHGRPSQSPGRPQQSQQRSESRPQQSQQRSESRPQGTSAKPKSHGAQSHGGGGASRPNHAGGQRRPGGGQRGPRGPHSGRPQSR